MTATAVSFKCTALLPLARGAVLVRDGDALCVVDGRQRWALPPLAGVLGACVSPSRTRIMVLHACFLSVFAADDLRVELVLACPEEVHHAAFAGDDHVFVCAKGAATVTAVGGEDRASTWELPPGVTASCTSAADLLVYADGKASRYTKRGAFVEHVPMPPGAVTMSAHANCCVFGAADAALTRQPFGGGAPSLLIRGSVLFADDTRALVYTPGGSVASVRVDTGDIECELAMQRPSQAALAPDGFLCVHNGVGFHCRSE